MLLLLTGRDDEALATIYRVIGITQETFHITNAYSYLAVIHFGRGDLAGVRRALADGRAAGAKVASMQVLEARIAAATGQLEEAGRLLMLAELSPEMGPIPIAWAVEISLLRNEPERALTFIARPIWKSLREPMSRLMRMFHPLLDEEPLAPRRSARTLVWPKEAPPLSPEIAALFADVRMESGLPSPTGV
jgi:hypothetical protein